jgi:hypothetical protein
VKLKPEKSLPLYAPIFRTPFPLRLAKMILCPTHAPSAPESAKIKKERAHKAPAQTVDKAPQDILYNRNWRHVRQFRHFSGANGHICEEKCIPVPTAARKIRRFLGGRPSALKNRGFSML